jgi:hypothetical protein
LVSALRDIEDAPSNSVGPPVVEWNMLEGGLSPPIADTIAAHAGERTTHEERA